LLRVMCSLAPEDDFMVVSARLFASNR
jgi:hypothetical protein